MLNSVLCGEAPFTLVIGMTTQHFIRASMLDIPQSEDLTLSMLRAILSLCKQPKTRPDAK